MLPFTAIPLLVAALASTASSTPVPPEWPNWPQWPPASSKGNLTIPTSSGFVTGFVDESFPAVRQFLGIPFAEPPKDSLRWELPVRVQDPNAHVNASVPPFACPQMPSTAGPPSLFSVSSPQFLNNATTNEDCLHLSVWAPTANLEEKLPVFIWIHGGGLISGSSSVAYQQPPAWIQRTQGHIVVALQYRLGIFGFPNAAGLNRTNLGLLDQRMGIEWVRDNIEAFGGDLNRTVLWGQSSGAGSVDAQNFAFPDDPIVEGFISDSGSAYFPTGTGLTTVDPAHSNFSAVAKGLGCPSDPAGQVSCLRNQTADIIISYLTNYSATAPMTGALPLNFVATPDNIVAFANYTERYQLGKLSSKPAIFGSNANEGVVMVPFPMNATTTGPNQTLANGYTLEIYQCPAYESASNRSAVGRKTYEYFYSGNFSDVSPLFWEGAYHMSELPQVFGTRGQYRANATSYEVQVSEAMQDLWLGFAKNLDQPEAVGWQEFSTGSLLKLGDPNGRPIEIVKQTDINAMCMQSPSQENKTIGGYITQGMQI